MPGVIIGEKKGFDIMYSSIDRKFHLQNSDGDEVGSGETQEDMEREADKLSKLKFKFPIQVFNISGACVEEGKITSLNPDEQTVWFVASEHTRFGSNRSKRRLRSCQIFERTGSNIALVGEIRRVEAKIKNMGEDISTMIGQLDKRIGLEYFGLEK